MKVIESILTKNPCYTAGRKITPKGLMLHSVGCSQPSAGVFVKNWNQPSHKNSCVHAFIDGNSGDVYQTLPWNHRGWHGGGSSNNTHIGVEMCEPACIKYTGGASFICSDVIAAKAVAARTYRSAVELFAMLCRQFDLDPLKDGVIVSHREGHARGIASNHGDPEHLWNQLGMGYTMDGFRSDVSIAMKRNTSAEPQPQVPCEPKEDKFSPYLVRVTIPNLNIRKGPGTSFPTAGFTGVGAFTIVEESAGLGSKAGWGRLKSGAGWISLDYAKRA